jgi:hypothetical protein
MCSILHQGRHHSPLGSSWSSVQPVLRHGCHRDSLLERETRTLCRLPERYPSAVVTYCVQQVLVRATSENMILTCTTRTSTATIFRGSVRHFVGSTRAFADREPCRRTKGGNVARDGYGFLLTVRKMMTSRPSRETVRRSDHSGGVLTDRGLRPQAGVYGRGAHNFDKSGREANYR